MTRFCKTDCRLPETEEKWRRERESEEKWRRERERERRNGGERERRNGGEEMCWLRLTSLFILPFPIE